MNQAQRHQAVIVGGGFGGLYATRSLANAPVHITLLDKRNFHLFQPLLYQVASGSLSPSDIAAPLRDVLANQRNVDVLMGEIIDIDVQNRLLTLRDGTLHFDTLILAPGSDKQYFGHEEWQQFAPGLKTVEDAVKIRRKVLLALENAEKEPDPTKRAAWMTFLVVGGGPTGVEMAGTLAELVHYTLKHEYHFVDLTQVRIVMVEAGKDILPTYPSDLRQKAAKQLERLGVTLFTDQVVKEIKEDQVTLSSSGTTQTIQAETILWTAGVKASPLGQILAKQTDCALDKGGRIMVEPDCSIKGFSNIFVIGDLANFSHTADQKPLPGVASVAIQQGQYVAHAIESRLKGHVPKAFHYHDKGSLAIIGRNAAVAKIGSLHISGFPAWVVWLLVHIFYLVGFDNKVIVTFQWAWNYITRGRGACLITEQI